MQRRVVLLVLLGILPLVSSVRAQDPCVQESCKEAAVTCDHGGYDVWDVLRVLPVRFTEFEGETARWKYRNERSIKLGSFFLQGNTQYVSRDNKEVNLPYVAQHTSNAWLCYYCSRCRALLRAYELKPGSLQF